MIPPISMAASRDQALSALNDFLPKVPFTGKSAIASSPGMKMFPTLGSPPTPSDPGVGNS